MTEWDVQDLRKSLDDMTADRDYWKNIVSIYVQRDTGMITAAMASELFKEIGPVKF